MGDLDGLNPDFRDILTALAERQAEFILVGAYALAFHGAPRASGDIDLFVRPTADNAQRVCAALVAFGAPVAQHGVTATDLATPGTVYQIGLPPRRIDILTQISGLDFDEAWASRVAASLDGHPIFVLGRAALIRNKLAAGRPKDLADVARLSRES